MKTIVFDDLITMREYEIQSIEGLMCKAFQFICYIVENT